jgi:hypothetical protein
MVPGQRAGSGKAAAGFRSPRPSASLLGVAVNAVDVAGHVARRRDECARHCLWGEPP